MSIETGPMPIHVAISRKIRPGHEQQFQELLREFFSASLARDGVHGVSMLVPPPGSSSREYGILRTFANQSEREAFYSSPMYLEWEKRVAPLTEGKPQMRELHGLEAFFRGNGPPSPPPRWKMAVATYIGVEIVTIPLALTLGRALKGWSLFLANPFQNIFVVGLLAWAVMPLVTKALSRWLNAKQETS